MVRSMWLGLEERHCLITPALNYSEPPQKWWLQKLPRKRWNQGDVKWCPKFPDKMLDFFFQRLSYETTLKKSNLSYP